MKREIKFRAFQDNQMLKSPISSNYGLTRFFGLLYEDTPIMQFTGLKDKFGQEIYEGDILAFEREKNFVKDYIHPFVVKWDSERAAWTQYSPRELVKVIGNIYENPELL